MKKQSGFTLIELMVVMAIIAILATAGLSAYTGYIKKARDTVRIADINAINTIVLGSMSPAGAPPQTAAAVHSFVSGANNGKGIFDPLSSQTDGSSHKQVCHTNNFAGEQDCYYTYRLCDGGAGYLIGTNFESQSNFQLMIDDFPGEISPPGLYDEDLYEIGSCEVGCTFDPTGDCPNADVANSCPTKINALGTTFLQC